MKLIRSKRQKTQPHFMLRIEELPKPKVPLKIIWKVNKPNVNYILEGIKYEDVSRMDDA